MNESTGYLLGRLWRDWIRKYLGRIAGAVALMAVVVATSAAYPKLIQLAIDMLGEADRRVVTLMPRRHHRHNLHPRHRLLWSKAC